MNKHSLPKLPVLIASSVIRSAHQGESHGGVYLVDMEAGTFDQVIDWNDTSINWEGRGADRGLRGIAFYKGYIYLAASDEIFVYDQNCKLIESFRNKYLQHCHEICLAGDTLYLSSTGFDSILAFDLLGKKFTHAYCIRANDAQGQFSFNLFNPNTEQGPPRGDTIHINSVYYYARHLYVSSLAIPNLMSITDDHKLNSYAPIPVGSHNTRPFLDGVLLNDTASEKVVYTDTKGSVLNSFSVAHYPVDKLKMSHLPQDHARQAFARGLCTSNDGWIFGGSSPSTISAYRLDAPAALKAVNITMDIRNSIHGLEIWPF